MSRSGPPISHPSSPGAGLQRSPPSGGRSFGNGWAAVDAGDASVFLRQIAGRWRVAGARRGALTVVYADFAAGRAATVRVTLWRHQGQPDADLSLGLSQLEINPPLDAKTFEVEVPRDSRAADARRTAPRRPAR